MTARQRVSEVRKGIPEKIKRIVAEREIARLMGIEYRSGMFQYDHAPALALREYSRMAQDFIPPQLDPEFISVKTEAAHQVKTSGRRGQKRSTSYGSDIHAIGKLDRLTPAQVELRRILTKPCGHKRRPTGSIPSRGFPKRPRKGKRHK